MHKQYFKALVKEALMIKFDLCSSRFIYFIARAKILILCTTMHGKCILCLEKPAEIIPNFIVSVIEVEYLGMVTLFCLLAL